MKSGYPEHRARPVLSRVEFSNRVARHVMPRPALVDVLYNHDYRLPEAGEAIPFVVNEYEPVFDDADF